MALNERDKQLVPEAQEIILNAKSEWEAANAEYQKTGDQAAKDRMAAANAKAEAARSQYGNYTAGTSGTDYIPNSSSANGGGGQSSGGYSRLSYTDQQLLKPDQQQQILALKDQYAAAMASGATGDELKAINELANKVRANAAGYSAGESGKDYVVLAYNQGGKSYEQLKAEIDAYEDKWYKPGQGWKNGYSTEMNTRHLANLVRQQMAANSKAWHTDVENRDELHQQNVELAKLLPNTTGGYDEKTGRWETWNPNVGYGYNMNGTKGNIRDAWKQYYGYTDGQIENWAKDTSHYYNFVDTRAAARNSIDESSGFTGQYAQFANGPYASLISTGAFSDTNVPWADTIGDGFGDEGTFMKQPQYDENGNIIKTAPSLKGNNDASAYTRQFLPVTVNGMLAGHAPKVDAMDPTTGDTNVAGQKAYYENYGRYANGGGSLGAGSGGYEGYLQQLYDSALQSQLAQLEASYNQNVSDLDANIGKVNDAYTEQKRQTTGTNAQEAAAWREMANAIGLNTGAIGQAALAQNNQLQSNLNTLESAEASALAEIERQRVLLGQQYQLQINQAISENNFQKAQALYEEAVRAEQQLMQQQQFASQMALQYAQLAQNQYQYETDLAMKYGKKETGDTQQVYIPLDPAAGRSMEELNAGLDRLRNIVYSSPTFNPSQINSLAWQYYDSGEIGRTQLEQFLKENGIGG